MWIYKPRRHKSQHHDKRREIILGPKAQEILRPLLGADPDACLFQPREATEDRNVRRRAARRSPMTPSQRARSRKQTPKRAPRDQYDTRAYCHAVHRGCVRAFPHPTLSLIPKKELTPEQHSELTRWRRARFLAPESIAAQLCHQASPSGRP